MKETKFYLGKYILTCGTPHLLINYWEDTDKYGCEIFVIFEKYDSTEIRMGRKIKIDKFLFTDLNDFLSRYAMNIAENMIFYEIIVQQICVPENKQIPNVQLNLSDYNKISWLSFINRKFNTTLAWIKANSTVTELNQSIDLVKSVQIDTSDF